ncbi:ATP-dependent nuclease [Ewingella americana]|uniref:ATP-dependent nuclease n=1 Tax=Ewingella americana TaxID=41202 RepID=UPI0012ADEB38|nr:AAA family ATPase [Ewingella americana]MRT02993.1 AAA family ATPase [Ewingella americana]
MKLSPNELKEEMDKVRDNKFNKYVKRTTLRNVRGFSEEVIDFITPVTALIGTNGGGKSTILGAVALAYKTIKPGKFFPKSFFGDESMSEWEIEMEITDKSTATDRNITRTAKFKQSKWRRDNFPERNVEYIEIQRTVPAGELSKFKQFLAGNKDDFDEISLNKDTITYATAVLDKNIANYKAIVKKSDPATKMYVGLANGDVSYSQFHFGAGEASVIETIDRIENSSDNSLILIEELENGLHPVAVRLFVNYLQNVAKRKKLQIIFTTHSQDAVNELPPEAVWASINKKVWNGKLSIESLRAITGQLINSKVIYVEDSFAKEWVENAIGRYASDISSTLKVYTAGGYPNVVKVSQFHNENPTITSPSIALVDGDIMGRPGVVDLPLNAMYLGDTYPDAIVFNYIANNKEELVSIIRQRCLLTRFTADRITREIESVVNSACDHHLYFSTLSTKLDFSSEIFIRAGMVDVFNEYNEDFWKDIILFVRNGLR